MVQRGDLGSWMSGPQAGAERGGPHPGARFGRPPAGRGAIAPVGRRLVALMVDWVLCLLIALAFLPGGSWWPLLVFAIEQAVLVGTLGTSVGHRLLGLRVELAAGGPAGPRRALIRTALLILVLPALFWDADQRGLHDQLAGTAIARG